MVQEILLVYKNLDDHTSSDSPKTMASKAILQVIEANPVSNIWRVSDDLSILKSSVVYHLHDFNRGIQSYWIALHVTKIFDSSKYYTLMYDTKKNF